MTYSVLLTRHAQRDLAGIAEPARSQIHDALTPLAQNPRPAGCVKLSGRAGWRIRVGTYRVIYDVDDTTQAVTVTQIGHRREIYHD